MHSMGGGDRDRSQERPVNEDRGCERVAIHLSPWKSFSTAASCRRSPMMNFSNASVSKMGSSPRNPSAFWSIGTAPWFLVFAAASHETSTTLTTHFRPRFFCLYEKPVRSRGATPLDRGFAAWLAWSPNARDSVRSVSAGARSGQTKHSDWRFSPSPRSRLALKTSLRRSMGFRSVCVLRSFIAAWKG